MRLEIMCKHKYHSGFLLDINLNCDVNAMAIFGPSGSGKTTILSAITGTLIPQHAKIAIDNQTIIDTDKNIILPPEKRLIGITPQHSMLFEHLSVSKNLMFGMPENRKWKKAISNKNNTKFLFDDVVKVLELEHLLERFPNGLSGGERQRVAIGRALLSQPRLLILDEPLAALDQKLKEKIIIYLKKIIVLWKIPTIIITHSTTVVNSIADFAIIINNGRIIDSGSPANIFPQKHIVSSHSLFQNDICA